MICANIVQVNGVSYVAPTGEAICGATDIVLLSQAEYQQATSPFYLDIGSAIAITAAIAGLWGAAYVLSVAKKAVFSPSGDEET